MTDALKKPKTREDYLELIERLCADFAEDEIDSALERDRIFSLKKQSPDRREQLLKSLNKDFHNPAIFVIRQLIEYGILKVHAQGT